MCCISGIDQLTPRNNPARYHTDSTGTACFIFCYR